MTDLDRDVLRILRVFGPCSNADVARHLGQPLHRTYRALGWLVANHFASHPKLQRWQLTRRGERVFREAPNRPLSLFGGVQP